MVNTSALRGAIVEAGFTVRDFAKKANFSQTSFSMKLNGKRDFTASEIRIITRTLNLNADRVYDIFFA